MFHSHLARLRGSTFFGDGLIGETPMMKLETYRDLRDAAERAAQARKECELEIFAALEAIDPELVNDGLELMAGAGAREVLAHYLTESIPALGGATPYEMLASGERARVIQLFGAIRHGVYL